MSSDMSGMWHSSRIASAVWFQPSYMDVKRVYITNSKASQFARESASANSLFEGSRFVTPRSWVWLSVLLPLVVLCGVSTLLVIAATESVVPTSVVCNISPAIGFSTILALVVGLLCSYSCGLALLLCVYIAICLLGLVVNIEIQAEAEEKLRRLHALTRSSTLPLRSQIPTNTYSILRVMHSLVGFGYHNTTPTNVNLGSIPTIPHNLIYNTFLFRSMSLNPVSTT